MDDPRLRLLGAAQAADAGRLLTALDTLRPIVTVSPSLPPAAAGAALTLVALLSRLFPHVQVDGSAHAGPNPWCISNVSDAAGRFQGVRPVPTTAAATDIRVSLGLTTGLRVRDRCWESAGATGLPGWPGSLSRWMTQLAASGTGSVSTPRRAWP